MANAGCWRPEFVGWNPSSAVLFGALALFGREWQLKEHRSQSSPQSLSFDPALSMSSLCDLGNGLNSLCLSVLCYTAMTVLPGIMWGVVRWHQLMSGGSKGSMCTTFHPQPGLSSQKEKEDAELTFNVAMDIIDSGFLWHCLLLRNSDMLDLCGCQLQFLNLDFYQKFPVLTETDIRKELLSNNGRFSIWLQAPSVVFFIPECREFQGFWSSTEL